MNEFKSKVFLAEKCAALSIHASWGGNRRQGGAPALLRFSRKFVSVILRPKGVGQPCYPGNARLKRVVSIATASSATVVTCVALGGALQPVKTYVIEIGGSPGVGVSGECRLAKADGGEERVPLEGIVR
jgi:hypothetical protein